MSEIVTEKIENKVFPMERALYGKDGLHLAECRFEGEEDGESALKECKNVRITDCYFDLRYPLWHAKNVRMVGSEMTEKCRAAIWYTEDMEIKRSTLGGIKAVRECKNIRLEDVQISSPEFGWNSEDIKGKNVDLTSEYPFMRGKEIRLENFFLHGKYSFQYVENVHIKNGKFDTKDAFWHAKNVVLENCIVKGEYLAWYSENLTLVHCKIIGTQPFCYAKDLKLVDCETEGCDLAFEYSTVDAEIKGEIVSVKNPIAGRIVADRIGEVILTADSKYSCRAEIFSKK